ncbi:helix-turn-helix domain-containing protein [[Clostridium] polysaccharolyticum]|uniref:Helix-turn-helix n=1 Tax=[Clostridium] polysaccharolyticum TaxID=29364 RepID=A0A1H9YI50_9FIRM|nr:helix-turn-helix transcriptional regulator [[Clostridium] polysaccharolyticum]SES68259.1 Helix-turn-helix [[Clostridium] polysaccharolyticum]
MEFRDLLKFEIDRLGLTQREAAEFLDVSLTTIEKWLSGKRKPSARTARSVLDDLKKEGYN